MRYFDEPQFDTDANRAKVSDAMERTYDRLSTILGGQPPMFILDLIDADLPRPIQATLTEQEWRLLRYAVERSLTPF